MAPVRPQLALAAWALLPWPFVGIVAVLGAVRARLVRTHADRLAYACCFDVDRVWPTRLSDGRFAEFRRAFRRAFRG